MATYELPITDLTKRITLAVHVTGLRAYKVRKAIGLLLVRLAAWVMSVGLEVDDGDDGVES